MLSASDSCPVWDLLGISMQCCQQDCSCRCISHAILRLGLFALLRLITLSSLCRCGPPSEIHTGIGLIITNALPLVAHNYRAGMFRLLNISHMCSLDSLMLWHTYCTVCAMGWVCPQTLKMVAAGKCLSTRDTGFSYTQRDSKLPPPTCIFVSSFSSHLYIGQYNSHVK